MANDPARETFCNRSWTTFQSIERGRTSKKPKTSF
jgi:hypothetical protein